jgi:hypothetical protein
MLYLLASIFPGHELNVDAPGRANQPLTHLTSVCSLPDDFACVVLIFNTRSANANEGVG